MPKRSLSAADETRAPAAEPPQQPMPRKVSSLLGHRGRVFDVRYLETEGGEEHVLSSSEDGTALLWNLKTKRVVSTLTHAKDSEVLRSAFLQRDGAAGLCTCGADGLAVLWTRAAGGSSYSKTLTLDHGEAQIYACEASVSGSALLTAADGQLVLWDLGGAGRSSPRVWSFGRGNGHYAPSRAQSGAEGHASGGGGGGGGGPSRWVMPLVPPVLKRRAPEAEEEADEEEEDDEEEDDGEEEGDDEEKTGGKALKPQKGGNGPTEGIRTNDDAEKRGGGDDEDEDEDDDDDEDDEEEDSQVVYGGPRNPDATNYIFDVRTSTLSPHVAALALSDGRVCTVDLREPSASSSSHSNSDSSSSSSSSGSSGSSNRRSPALAQTCQVYESLRDSNICPGGGLRRSHATSVSWTGGDEGLLVGMGSGAVAVLDVRKSLQPRAYLCAHSSACYGTTLVPAGGHTALSWSGDGVLNEWSAVNSREGLHVQPSAVHAFKAFPVFSCAVASSGAVLCAGGGAAAESFLGVPIHVLAPPRV